MISPELYAKQGHFWVRLEIEMCNNVVIKVNLWSKNGVECYTCLPLNVHADPRATAVSKFMLIL